ncbi:MAG: MFS transporter [Chloroflexi bacterium]|nr:MFS transporter [Chloroflexota bacterium]
MIKRKKFPRIYFGWWAVVTGSFLNLWGAGYTVYGFGALFKPLSAELGFSRAVTSVASSIGRFGGGIEAPLTGWLTDRYGPKWIALFGVSLFGLGLILMKFVNSLWSFYLVWGVIVGTAANLSSGIPINTAIANWFVKKRGIALGIRVMISGVFALPIITWLIVNQGWRIANVVGGLVMLLVGLPLVWFFIRQHRPEYYGLLPDGATVATGSPEDTKQMIERGVEYAAEVEEIEFTLRQAIRTPAYWILILFQSVSMTSMSSLMVHFMPLLTDIGMTPTKAAATMTIVGFFSVVARFGGGFVADRLRKTHLRFFMGGACLLQAGGITIFLLNQTVAVVYPFLIPYFIGGGINMVLMSVIGGRYFGRKAFGSVRGSSAMFTMPLGMLLPVYFGWVFDTTDSYAIAFTAFAGLLVFTTALLILTPPPRAPTQVTDIRKLV